MKQNKILENRPELTQEQIREGMDFNKIKKNAAHAKSKPSRSVFIKGILIVILIPLIFLIYRNYNNSIKNNTAIIIDSTSTTIASKIDSLTIYERKIKEEVKSPKSKTRNNDLMPSLSLATDTNRIDSTVKKIDENTKNYNGNYSKIPLPDKEMLTTHNSEVFETTPGKVSIKEINKSLSKINKRLYASQFEVSNKLYMSFLNSLRESDNPNLSIALIDTLKWTDALSYNEPYVRYYHAHPAYYNYPVVNISHKAARLFCEWLTVQYNADPKRKVKKVLIRLPSEEEWIMAARGIDRTAIYPWGGLDVRNKKGQMMANFKLSQKDDSLRIAGVLNANADVTAPVNSYSKNSFGLYNMSGNVAEMVEEKGIAKGGSWKDNAEHLKINSILKYDGKPQPYVGFRYFVEILEE